jgi:hypothetical protein
MRNLLCVSLGVALAVSVLLVLVAGSVGRPEPDLLEEARLNEELRTKSVALLARAFHKQAAADDVLAGRLTLLQAAARFRDLNRQPPEFHWELFRAQTPGMSDDERHCRAVIDLIRRDRTVESAAIARLEQELEGHLRRGTLDLPESVRGTAGNPSGWWCHGDGR